MFSKACEYAIRAALYIAVNTDESKRVSIPEIAKSIDSPVAFTGKILQSLVKAKVIFSQKGPTGGFYLPQESAENIFLSQIVEALDGDRIFTGCGLGLPKCDEKCPCPLHEHFLDIRTNLANLLTQTSLADLSSGLHKGESFLKRVS